MRASLLLSAVLLVAFTRTAYGDATREPPTSKEATAALKKFGDARAKAKKNFVDAQASVQRSYTTDLQRLLDSSMKSAKLEDANWAKAELDRLKSGAADPTAPTKSDAVVRTANRLSYNTDKAQGDYQRALEAARKQYIAELESAGRAALALRRDLEEANRITAEVEHAKVMDLSDAPAVNPVATATRPAETISLPDGLNPSTGTSSTGIPATVSGSAPSTPPTPAVPEAPTASMTVKESSPHRGSSIEDNFADIRSIGATPAPFKGDAAPAASAAPPKIDVAVPAGQKGDLATAEKLYKQRDFAGALVAYAAVVRDDPQKLREVASTLADLLAFAGRFQETAETLEYLAQVEPKEIRYLYRAAVIRAFLGHDAAYRADCRTIISRFAASKDRRTAEKISKTCLLRPGVPQETTTVERLIELSLQDEAPDPYLNAYRFVKALSTYRNGRFSESVSWLQKANGEYFHITPFEASAALLMAANAHKMDNSGRRDANLRQARAILEELVPPSPRPGVPMENWFVGRTLESEVRALVGDTVWQSAAPPDVPRLRLAALVSKPDQHQNVFKLVTSPDLHFAGTVGSDRIRIWDLQRSELVNEFVIKGVMGLAWHPVAEQLLVGQISGGVTLQKLADGTAVRSFPGHAGEVRDIAMTADGHRALTGCFDRMARFWNTDNGELLRTLEGHLTEITAVGLSPDGTVAITGEKQGTYIFWSLPAGSEIARVQHKGWPRSIRFSPDGSLVVLGSSGGPNNSTAIYDPRTATRLRALAPADVVSTAFSGDGKRVVCGTSTGHVEVFDAATGQRVAALPRGMELGQVWGVAFVNHRILTACDAEPIRLWEIPE